MRAVTDNLDVFLQGMRTTAGLTVLSFTLAMVIGILVAAARVGPVPPLRWAGVLYTETFRNMPLAILMYLLYFGLPKVDLRFEPFPTAVMALSLYTGAFVAETVRAGINTVSDGEVEAARALGLRFTQVLSSVVMPQALRSVVGPLGGLLSALIRNSAVAYTISVVELTLRTYRLNNDLVQPEPLFLGAALAYLIMTIPCGVGASALQRRFGIKR
jgi:glutamate transport system permease protein